MPEQKKDAPKQEKHPKEKHEEKKKIAEEHKPSPKKEAQKEQAPAPVPDSPAAKKKKINKMTLAEIETKLEELKKSRGGLTSKYAQQLGHRKNTLKS